MLTSFAPERAEDRTDWLSHVAPITMTSARMSTPRDTIATRDNQNKLEWQNGRMDGHESVDVHVHL